MENSDIKNRSKKLTIGKYRIIKVLGNGSFGIVYKCEYKDQIVAIKKLIGYTKQQAKELLKEGKIMMELSHQNLVKCLDAFLDENNVPHLVLEYCNGGDLSGYLEKQQKKVLREKDALYIFCQILQGLAYLHKKGIIHRDIKASNIIIHNGIFKIADFGLATKIEKNKGLNQVWGTIPYMAPEILDNWRQYTLRVDTWAVCVTLYVMMYHAYPFGFDSMEVQKKKIRDIIISGFTVPRKLHQFNDTSDDLHDLFFKIFKYEPSLRVDFQQILKSNLMKKYVDQYNKELQKRRQQEKQNQTSKLDEFFQDEQIDLQKEIDFYSSNEFSLMLNRVQSKEYPDENVSKKQIDKSEDDEEENQIDMNFSTEIMLTSAIEYRTRKVRDKTFKKNLQPYNLCISIITFLKAAYNEISNNNSFSKFIAQKNVQLTKFFMQKTIYFYISSLHQVIKEKENIFDCEKWGQFSQSQSYLQLKIQLQEILDQNKTQLSDVFRQVEDFSIDNQQIQQCIEINNIKASNEFYKKLPDQIKYPFRALNLLTYLQIAEQLDILNQKSPKFIYQQKQQAHNIDELERCGLVLLISSLFLKIFTFKPPYIQLSRFDIKEGSKLRNLLEWFNKLSLKEIQHQSEDLLNKYFPKIRDMKINI